MRILVCGGREFDDWRLFSDTLSEYDLDNQQPITIIEGGAKGADFCGRLYAKYCGWEHLPFLADWNKYGKRAGYLRNKQMLVEGKPDLVIAFPGNAGTADMIRQAKDAGVEVREIGKNSSS